MLYFLSNFNKLIDLHNTLKCTNLITGRSIKYQEPLIELLNKAQDQQIEKLESDINLRFLQIIVHELLYKGILIPIENKDDEETYLNNLVNFKKVASGFFKSTVVSEGWLDHFEPSANSEPVILFIGIPSDVGSSVPGTRYGPQILRSKSISSLFRSSKNFLVDLSHGNKNVFENKQIYDIGDINLFNLNLTQSLKKIEDIVSYFPKSIIPFFIGGDHLFTLPIIRDLYQKSADFTLVHFDNHLDVQVWGDFENFQPKKLTSPSHSNFISWIKAEMPDLDILQIGINSYQSIEPKIYEQCAAYLNSISTRITNLDIHLKPKNSIYELFPVNKNIYLTIDVDVLHNMTLTGYPAVHGISFNDLLLMLVKLLAHNKLIGVDIMEFGQSNKHDLHSQSAIMVNYIILEILKWIK